MVANKDRAGLMDLIGREMISHLIVEGNAMRLCWEFLEKAGYRIVKEFDWVENYEVNTNKNIYFLENLHVYNKH